jgi:hypothetical protein
MQSRGRAFAAECLRDANYLGGGGNFFFMNAVCNGAAAAVGEDRPQRMSEGRVSPDSFTHGSSAQRVQWLRRGLEQGQISACNTFGRGSGS